MSVVAEQAPREHHESQLVDQKRKAREEILGIGVAGEDRAPVDAADHHVMHGAADVRAKRSRHDHYPRARGREG